MPGSPATHSGRQALCAAHKLAQAPLIDQLNDKRGMHTRHACSRHPGAADGRPCTAGPGQHAAAPDAWGAAPTRMSSAHMRLSKGRLSLNFSMSGSVLPVKRPPHSFFCSAPAGRAAASGAADACREEVDKL